MKAIFTTLLLFSCLLLVGWRVQAQGSDQIATVRSAIASGSSRELAQYLAPSVEVGFNGDTESYNSAQAEIVMRDFFAKNPPGSFDIQHQGASTDGIPYASGRYVSRTGTYQVFIKLKAKRPTPTIDSISFTKE